MKLYYRLMDKIFDPEDELPDDYKRPQYNFLLLQAIAGFVGGFLIGHFH